MWNSLNKQRLIAAAILALGAGTASAAVLTRTYVINTAVIQDLFSATFDGSLIPCSTPTPPDAQECAFFGGYTPPGRNIQINNVGTGSGTLTVNWETTTGEILQVNEMRINLAQTQLVINDGGPNPTVVDVIPGNNVPVASPGDVAFIEAGTGTAGRDLDGAGFQTILGAGSADPDQGVAIGQAAVFQHQDPTNNPDTPDFAVFNDVVDTCSGNSCALISAYVITLDGVRYRLEGTVSAAGGNSLVLKSQTSNNSIYRVGFTTAVDTDGDGIPDATDNCPLVANANQADTDGDLRGNACDNCRLIANNTGANAQCDSDNDGFGNRCDGDFNNNNSTNAQDTTLFRQQLGQPSTPPTYNSRDLNCNGSVNAQDTTLFRQLLGQPPGPGAGP